MTKAVTKTALLLLLIAAAAADASQNLPGALS
jgi:hypothetical protein